MINRFKQLWIKKGMTDMIQEESDGAAKYHGMADKFEEMAEEEEGHKANLKEMNAKKSVDTSYAGPIPKSDLAEQDLEGDTTKSFCPNCGLPSGIYITRFDGQDFVSVKSQNICKCNDMTKAKDSKMLPLHRNNEIIDSNGKKFKVLDSQTIAGGGRMYICEDLSTKERVAIRDWAIDKSMNKANIPSVQDVDDNYKGKVRGIYNNKVYDSVDDYNLSSDDNPRNKSQTTKNISVSFGPNNNKENNFWVKTIDSNGKIIQHFRNISSVEAMGYVSLALRNDHIEHVEYGNTSGLKQIMKGAIEQTGKVLDQIADKAEEVTDTEEKCGLVGKIKAIQLKRQQAIINAREKSMTKSFKKAWAELTKDLTTDARQDAIERKKAGWDRQRIILRLIAQFNLSVQSATMIVNSIM